MVLQRGCAADGAGPCASRAAGPGAGRRTCAKVLARAVEALAATLSGAWPGPAGAGSAAHRVGRRAAQRSACSCGRRRERLASLPGPAAAARQGRQPPRPWQQGSCCAAVAQPWQPGPGSLRQASVGSGPWCSPPGACAPDVPLGMRPAGRDSLPTWMTPLRKVPVVTTTALQLMDSPLASRTPATRGLPPRCCSSTRSVTAPSCTCRPGTAASAACTRAWGEPVGRQERCAPGLASAHRRQRPAPSAQLPSCPATSARLACMWRLYSARSICARSPRTAGPLEPLSCLQAEGGEGGRAAGALLVAPSCWHGGPA
jgi:hypothetical protein